MITKFAIDQILYFLMPAFLKTAFKSNIVESITDSVLFFINLDVNLCTEPILYLETFQ